MMPAKAFLRLALFLSIAAVARVHAQTTLLAWDFAGQSSPATLNATTPNGNIDSSTTLTRGTTASASSASNSFRTTGFQNNGISTSNTDYFQFTASAASGYTLSLTSIDYRTAGTSSFAVSPGVSMQFAYSADGTNFTLIGSPAVTTAAGVTAQPTVDLSGISALQSLADTATITFRFYASGQTTTGGWGFASNSTAGAPGLTLTGTLTAPTVASLTWSGSSGGTWDTSTANFSSGAATWDNTANAAYKAIFPTASQSITVGTITAASVQFDASGIALSGGTLTNGNASSAFTAFVTNSSDTATVSTSLNDGGKGFTKDGSGTLVLSGTQSGITGGVTVTNGTLQTDTATIGTQSITNNATITFSQSTNGTYSGTLTNNGTFTKAGTGNVTIGTAVSGTGATTVSGGTLTAGVDSAIASGALTVGSGTTLDLGNHNATVASLALTGATISNVGTLTVAGTGAITTSADSSTATISGGALALGSGAHTITVADGSATTDVTISSPLTGSGVFTKAGAGTLALTGNNSGLTGGVTLGSNSGIVALGSSSALGVGVTKLNGGALSGNGSALTVGGNTLQLQGGGGTISGSSDLTLSGTWDTTSGAVRTLTITNTGITTLSGAFTIASSQTLTLAVNTNLTMSGVIGGASATGLTKSGTGTLVLSGANTFTGTTIVNNGTLQLGASNVIADAVNFVVNAITAGATAAFDLDGNSDTIGTLTFGGANGTSTSTSNVLTGLGTLTLGGDVTFDATGNPLGSTLSGNLALGAARTFNVGDSSNAATDLTVAAAISGSGFGLTKSGAGTLALNGNNSYSGGTSITAGTVVAGHNNALGTGSASISSGATLSVNSGLTIPNNLAVTGTLSAPSGASFSGAISGGGSLSGTLTVASGGSIAPGASPGNLTVAAGSSLTFNSGSTYAWDLGSLVSNSNGTAGTHWDLITLAGTAQLVTNSVFLVPSFASNQAPSQGDSFWSSAQSWTVVQGNASSTITGTLQVNNSSWLTNGSFATALSGTDLMLNWTPSAIPEPSTYAAMFGAAALGLAVWRRRHAAKPKIT